MIDLKASDLVERILDFLGVNGGVAHIAEPDISQTSTSTESVFGTSLKHS
jgi:hypothetical protein